ncbi:PREDICTED: acyltransferase-like protein At3g26840, chloroplastic [Lupinus angustifolius]|uniref:acyltransferase-like protein At3g26840, chloroplastic n=1 Tax=Lupinus angustifolius TaxID=3871 RepID=UPI00092F1652|nr:PREDICTED: acyltransferase-like protein At3g26840, chloroplastic [Lupinus angustifolius]
MAAIGASLCPAASFPVHHRQESSHTVLKLKANRIPIMPPRFAHSVDRVPETTSTAISPNNGIPWVKVNGEEGTLAEKEKRGENNEEEELNRRSSWRSYVEQTKEIAKPDGGPPRWFSPLESGSRLDKSPLLLFLPGIDGVGLGLTSHHQKLGSIFDVWCLHIPVADRTPFIELVKIVEKTVRSEHQQLPNRPIYLVGESLGGCLALAVAAHIPDIDVVLILANPATSFGRSQWQLLTPLLEAMHGPLSLFPPEILSSMPGDPLRLLDNLVRGFPLQNTARELLEDFTTFSGSLPVLANILPIETLQWKLKLLKSASAYVNSRLHAIKAQTLILCSGNDRLLPSQQEGERLRQLLPKCELRKFEGSGHFLFLEGSVDLVTVIKRASLYRRGKYHDYVSDFLPPTPNEAKEAIESNSFINTITSPVMLSTLEDGTVERGLAGIPSEGPVLFVGYHMMLGLDIVPLISRIFMERNILVRGLAHPMLFIRKAGGLLPDESAFDAQRLMGAVPVGPTGLFKLLSSKSHILLFPGGMREALHKKGEEYKLFWPEQSEFVRMAARFGAKIVPFGTIGEDDVGNLVFDYDDMVKIPPLKSAIEDQTKEVPQLRTDVVGELGNQPVYFPGFFPKVPGRFYFYFGKPFETKGRKLELKDREKAHELYLEIKSEVERCLDYLKEKRESDPYRSILSRSLYQAIHGFMSEVPTFEI